MNTLVAYQRFSGMTDRRFCPLEEIIGLNCTEDFERLQLDPWAALMVAFAKLSGDLDHAKTDKDLRKSVKKYEHIIAQGGANYEACRDVAIDVLSQASLHDGRPFATHEIN